MTRTQVYKKEMRDLLKLLEFGKYIFDEYENNKTICNQIEKVLTRYNSLLQNNKIYVNDIKKIKSYLTSINTYDSEIILTQGKLLLTNVK